MGSADVMGMAEFRSFGETKTKKKKKKDIMMEGQKIKTILSRLHQA